MALDLTQADVKRLISDSSPETRMQTAEKVSRQFEGGHLTAKERSLAEDIFRVMLKDVEVQVRAALSKQLKNSSDVPHDVALFLAEDADEVALPFLKGSKALTDDDLLKIAKTHGEAKQNAIARRDNVSEELSDVLINIGSSQIIESLVGNDGANLSESSLNKIVDSHGENERIQGALVYRKSLPISVAERLVTMVSEALRDRMVEQHKISPDVAARLTRRSREAATLGLITPWSDEHEVERLIDSLLTNDRLTPTIILRSLCVGGIAFFECALATMARVPLINARTLIHDKGELGLNALYDKAGLPPEMFPTFRAAIDVFDVIQLDGEAHDAERFSRRMLERLMTTYGETDAVGQEDMDFLLNKLERISAACANT